MPDRRITKVTREQELPVTFHPGQRTVYVLPGTLLMEAAAVAGLPLEQPCGGAGKCGKCRVRVAEGAGAPTAAEAKVLSADELERGLRLGCQTAVRGPMTIEVPETSRLGVQRILTHAEPTAPLALGPAVRKVLVDPAAPRRGDDAPDMLRLERQLGPFRAGLDMLRILPGRLREAEFRGTAVLVGDELIDFEPGDTRPRCYGVAVDLGTTTLAASLVDLAEGNELAVAAQLNPQTRLGDDVLSRIARVAEKAEALGQLQQAVVGALNDMFVRLSDQAGLRPDEIYEVTISGNTTMQQLCCGLDPQWLGRVPFVPAVGRGLELSAGELDLRIHPRGKAFVMPVIGGFVGGDTTSGILATSLAGLPGPAMLIDIGTNGEIVLAAGGRLWAASTAAGPAFEGARISRGMRAAPGAIDKVVVDGRLRINTIEGQAPAGLCGSALIDVTAELLRHGLLTPQGRLARREELPADVPSDLAERLVACDGQAGFLLAAADETADGKDLALTQRDVRETQLATGAIRAGTALLLRRAGLEARDLRAVLLAGGFGTFLRRSNAQRMGLLPPEVEHERILFQGNTSLAGARWVLLSQEARREAEELARRVEHVDLSSDADFQSTFADAMLFPGDPAD